MTRQKKVIQSKCGRGKGPHPRSKRVKGHSKKGESETRAKGGGDRYFSDPRSPGNVPLTKKVPGGKG